MPTPLFSSPGSVFRRRRPRPTSTGVDTDATHSTDTEDEDYVERSLPPSPADAHATIRSAFRSEPRGPNARAGPSRAMEFAMGDEAIMRHAAGAWGHAEDEQESVGDAAGLREEQTEVKPDPYDSDDDIRPIHPDDVAHQEDHLAARGMPGDFGGPHGDAEPHRRGWRRHVPAAEAVPLAEPWLHQGGLPANASDAGDEVEEEDDIPAEDERQCRICFSGTEEEATMGRLISPCLCTGSMRCHHRYQLRRTLVSGLATSRPLLLLLSSILFFLLAISTGHLVHRFLLTSSPASGTGKVLTRKALPTRNPLGILDYFQEDWDWDDGFGGGMVIIGGGGGAGSGTLIYDIVLAAVDTFSAVAERFATAYGSRSRGSGAEWLFFALAIRFLLGLAILGSLSFLSLLLSLSLFAPFQLANGLRGTGVFNSLNRRARATGARAAAGGGGGTPAGQMMIIIFVLVGAANTISQVYRVVRAGTERALKYVETQILEVNPEDRRRARQRTREARRDRRAKWYRVWWREKRWATRQGWEEVRVRLYMAARAGLAPIWDRLGVQGHEDEAREPARGRARGLLIE